MQKELKKILFMTAMSASVFCTQTHAVESATNLGKPSTTGSEREKLLLKELTKLNQRINKLNKQVLRLEDKNIKKASTNPEGIRLASVTHYPNVINDASPRIVKPENRRSSTRSKKLKTNINNNYRRVSYISGSGDHGKDSKFYRYPDKHYYDISPEDLNRTTYFQIVNQNSPQSTAYNDLCIKNGLCFSALTNFDLRYYTRAGGIDSITGVPSLIGVGIRPAFGEYDSNVIGSINNANLFIDGYINPYVTAHMNLAYVNGSVKSRTFSHNSSDWSSVYRDASALKMDEVFGTLVIPSTPFYVRIGRQYLNFGDYKPYPITESLVQLITQMRSGGIIGGFVLPGGLYASANYSMARQSLENLGHPFAPIFQGNKDRNFGGKIGYFGDYKDINFNVNASFIHDIRDSDYLNENAALWTYDIQDGSALFFRGISTNQAYTMKQAAGIAAHVDMQWQRFGMLAEFATALSRLSDSPASRIRAWGVHGNVALDTFSYPSLLDVGFERGYDSQVFQTLVFGPLPVIPGVALPLQLGNALPKYRIVGTYSLDFMPGIKLSAQWVHDKDTTIAPFGSGRTSDIGILRLTAQL